jgi:hypothetical protein
MVKCEVCKNTLATLFLEKIKGTYVKKEGSSKKYAVCFDCQKKLGSKEEILKHVE